MASFNAMKQVDDQFVMVGTPHWGAVPTQAGAPRGCSELQAEASFHLFSPVDNRYRYPPVHGMETEAPDAQIPRRFCGVQQPRVCRTTRANQTTAAPTCRTGHEGEGGYLQQLLRLHRMLVRPYQGASVPPFVTT